MMFNYFQLWYPYKSDLRISTAENHIKGVNKNHTNAYFYLFYNDLKFTYLQVCISNLNWNSRWIEAIIRLHRGL